MTSTPLLHIGYHKTATTWFQKVFYPACREAYLAPRRDIRQVFLCPTAFAFDPRKARLSFSNPDHKRTIICDEGLVGHYGNAGFLQALSKDVAYRLYDSFPDGQVVIFLRNQLDMLKATYLQYIRRGGTRTVKQFLWPYYYQPHYRTKAFKKAMFCLEHLQYQHLIRHYHNVFGRENVHVFFYEDFQADPLGFLYHYARTLELDIDIDDLDPSPRNMAYGLVTARLARVLNYVTVGDMENSLTIAPLLRRKTNENLMAQINRTRLAGPKLTTSRLFGDELKAQIASYYGPSNRALAKNLGVALGERGYPLTDESDDTEAAA